MKSKKCATCNIEKDINCFHKWKYGPDGYKRVCKDCRKLESKSYNEKNYEIIKQKKSVYRKKNFDKIKETKKRIYEKDKERILLVNKKYRSNNREKINEHQRNRKLNDPLFKLKHIMNSRMRIFMKSNNITKRNRTFEIVGCSPEYLKEHLEKQFTDGMSWEKLGKEIHIDHIIPLASAKNEEEVYRLCHYSNLQPLWAIDNIKKGSKTPF